MPPTYVKISSGTLGSAVSTFSITSIPNTYSILKLYLNLRHSGTHTTVQMRVNNQTSSTSYYYSQFYVNQTSRSFEATNSSYVQLYNCNGGTNMPTLGALEMTFPNANLTTGNQGKAIYWQGGVSWPGSTDQLASYGFASVPDVQTAAISTLEFSLATGTFTSINTWQLYGIQ